MIHVNEKNVIGNRSFAEDVFANIKPILKKQLDEGEMNDFENEINFFGFIALQYLKPKDFNVVAHAMLKADVSSSYTIKLTELLRSDPRFIDKKV